MERDEDQKLEQLRHRLEDHRSLVQLEEEKALLEVEILEAILGRLAELEQRTHALERQSARSRMPRFPRDHGHSAPGTDVLRGRRNDGTDEDDDRVVEIYEALDTTGQLHNDITRLRRRGILTPDETRETMAYVDRVAAALADKLPEE